MIKVSDYIANRLASKYEVKHIFLISGGGAMHLNDAFGKQDGITYICNHHEQASAIAAEGYARYKQKLAVVNVTTGPGGINTLNGVFGQWTDSVPVLYISGQVKYETTIHSCPNIPLRQLGDQEADIIALVKPITKYAKTVTVASDIKRILDEAIYMATTGRMGPVWVDVPLNIQGALIEEDKLPSYIPKTTKEIPAISKKQMNVTVQLLLNAKRPLIVAGHGIRLAKMEPIFLSLLENLNIPVVTTFNGFDVLATSHPNYIGRVGTVGQRAGNFALQNADVILFLGTRNNIRQISYNWEFYARHAQKIVVDIDPAELQKPTLKPDIAIHANLSDFLPSLSLELQKLNNPEHQQMIDTQQSWLNWCLVRKDKYAPDINPDYQNKNNTINPYFFIQKLTNLMTEDYVTVAGNGSACVCLFQAGIVKPHQRIFWNSGNASMGYDLPAAIGLCVASGKNTVCIAGDGSIMMNLQELQTVKHYNLPIKVFILNNDGYVSIRQTQSNFFAGRIVGASVTSGVSTPDFCSLATSIGIKSIKIASPDQLTDLIISDILQAKEPIICEVIVSPDQIFTPKLSSQKLDDGTMISKPLEDMFPFLDRAEFAQNMLAENEKL